MPNAWDSSELEQWWDRFHGMPARGVVTLEEQEQLAAEADEAEGWLLIERPPQPRQGWYYAGAVLLAVLVAIAWAELILWLPKVGRLIQ